MGIFKTLFDLRLKAHNRPLEDYLTEILAFILNQDLNLLNDFFEFFQITDSRIDSYDVTTQLVLKKLENQKTDSRPDIAIFSEKNMVFFENKINSKEGYKQLKRYAEHLDNLTDEKKTLVYITKHFDIKNPEIIFENCKDKINFIQIRWYNVYRFLKKYKSKPIVLELLIFMKQINLSMNNQFNPSDIITLTNFNHVRKMMDESMLGDVDKKFKEINNGRAQDSTFMTELKHQDRYIFSKKHKEKLWVGLGYWMNSKNEKDYPDLGIVLEIGPNSKSRKRIIEIFKKIKNNNESWGSYNLSKPKSWTGITYRRSLQSFLSEDNQIEKIKEFFLEALGELEKIIEENDLPLK